MCYCECERKKRLSLNLTILIVTIVCVFLNSISIAIMNMDTGFRIVFGILAVVFNAAVSAIQSIQLALENRVKDGK